MGCRRPRRRRRARPPVARPRGHRGAGQSARAGARDDADRGRREAGAQQLLGQRRAADVAGAHREDLEQGGLRGAGQRDGRVTWLRARPVYRRLLAGGARAECGTRRRRCSGTRCRCDRRLVDRATRVERRRRCAGVPARRGRFAVASDASTDRGADGTDAGSAPGRPRRSRPARTDWRLGGRTVSAGARTCSPSRSSRSAARRSPGRRSSGSGSRRGPRHPPPPSCGSGCWCPSSGPSPARGPVGLLRFRPLDRAVRGRARRAAADSCRAGSRQRAAAQRRSRRTRASTGDLPSTWCAHRAASGRSWSPRSSRSSSSARVVLVALYTVLRRPLGKPLAGAIARARDRTALFVVVHALVGRHRHRRRSSRSRCSGSSADCSSCSPAASGAPCSCTSSTTRPSSCSRSSGTVLA